MLVVDACVALKWHLKEELSEAAADLLLGPDILIAPPNISDEIIEGLLRASRQNRITLPESFQLMEDWGYILSSAALRIYTLAELSASQFVNRAIQYSVTLKYSFYDCQYLALADIQECSLITADKQFYQRATPHYDKIRLLGT